MSTHPSHIRQNDGTPNNGQSSSTSGASVSYTAAGEWNGFSPRSQAAPTVRNTPGPLSPDVSPTATSQPTMPDQQHNTASWEVDISPTTSTFAPPTTIAQPSTSIVTQQPSDLQVRSDSDDEDDDHLPSFTAPSPSAARGSPGQSSREALRASMSIPIDRPTFRSANSEAPLLGDISATNTPMSAISNPFNDRKQVDPPTNADNGQSATPRHLGSTTSIPPRIQINSIPNSPGSPHTSTVPTALPPMSSPFGTPLEQPASTPLRSSLAQPSAPPTDRRVSLAPTTGTHRSGLSVTSGFDVRGSKPSTIAERRSQRMKQVMSKKGKKEGRDGKPTGAQVNRRPFQSTRLKEEIYKPWLEKKDPAQRWARWITLLSIFLGVAVMGVICWDGYNSVPKLGNVCPVLMDDFSNGLDTSVWTRENRVDGFGHGSFDWTSASPNNSFVDGNTLYLVPTLTSDVLGESAIQNGYTLNLTADGTCTSTNTSQCVAVSNSSQLTVINPVMSARLTTRQTVNIRYGKIEVVARFPTGDWLWPSINLYPVNETYGKGVRSGSVEIVTGRGNNASYTQRGVDYAQSTLHWGPTTDLDRSWMTWGYREQRRSSYNQGFRTFGFEWNDKYLWTYIDSRVSQVVSLRFDQSFWNKGKFPSTITNTTTGDVVRLTNPWINSNNNNAPFDQPFYLSLSLAVGATDGWFPDGEGGKPWLDNSLSAMSDFWNAKNRWWSNWPSDPKTRGFAIKSVKMWKTC